MKNTIPKSKIKEKIKELENGLKWRIKYCQDLEKDLFENCSNYVIPKSKIKEKIKDLEDFDIEFFDTKTLILAFINSLQELLGNKMKEFKNIKQEAEYYFKEAMKIIEKYKEQ